MRYLVPQFIDVEDKLFGPLTLRQAIYLAGGGGAAFVSFTWLGFFFGVLVGLPIAFFSFALAFVKINDRPFFFVVYAALFYAMRGKLYLWKRMTKAALQQSALAQDAGKALEQERLVPKLSQSRLKELAWTLDTHDTLYTNEDQWK